MHAVDQQEPGHSLEERNAIEGFQTIAEAMPCIVWIADASGAVEWYSQSFYKYSGQASILSITRGWTSIIHENDRQAVMRAYAHAVSTKTRFETVARLRKVTGQYSWFSICACPFRGSTPKWLGTLTDINDRQTASEANVHVVDALMKGYLTSALPKVKGLKFDSLYKAANVVEKLGGDWYDAFTLPDGRVGVSIGDVCGHGIDAAVKMGEAKQAIFVAACLDVPVPPPENVLSTANRVLFLRRNHILTTALYGCVDPATHTFTYASAGHHPPMLAKPNEATVILPNHGFPLGVEENMPPCNTHEFIYESGSMIVLYTDGLIEFTRDLADGESHLLSAAAEALTRNVEHPATYIVEKVLGDAFPSDDIAILTISFS
ncbi:MAG TPA: SpoIIE family protein phosphatase [Candidatus Baltobacteraceae bacterium]|jgi:PAS domain S-box-containing protein|nr:SpoIIE family protein phosphatase [Candidatus Baltobacteraceae bacterium]